MAHALLTYPDLPAASAGHLPPPLWPAPEPAPLAPAAPGSAVARARAYIEAHWAESFTLDQLARVSYASKYHLVRTFRRAFGLPPHTYQLRLRLTHALRMLVGGSSITRVAYDAGFADQAHLTRSFKRAYGVTPGVYLSAHRSRLARRVAA